MKINIKLDASKKIQSDLKTTIRQIIDTVLGLVREIKSNRNRQDNEEIRLICTNLALAIDDLLFIEEIASIERSPSEEEVSELKDLARSTSSYLSNAVEYMKVYPDPYMFEEEIEPIIAISLYLRDFNWDEWYTKSRGVVASSNYAVGDTVFSRADPKSPFVIVTFVTDYKQGDIAVVRQEDNLGDPEGGKYPKILYEVPVVELYDDMNPSLEKKKYYRLKNSEIEALEQNLLEEEEWQEGMNPSPYSDKDF